MSDKQHDVRVRMAAFSWLERAVAEHGDVLTRDLLSKGFEFDGTRVPMVAPNGIFKPSILSLPLTIATSPNSPYDDRFSSGGLLDYRYRGTDPFHRDNRGLRTAMEGRLPLVYFHGLVPGRYVAIWPVFIVGDDPSSLTFTVAVDDAASISDQASAMIGAGSISEDMVEGRRLYATAVVKRRIHQRAFRERVLDAYRRACSFCRFRHEELLDAAHIVPDSEPDGIAAVQNGLALCRLHHAAFDRHFLGVRPDGVIQVRRDILEEEDGPTLKHAIQALHGVRLQLARRPALYPSPKLLEMRYERFLHQD